VRALLLESLPQEAAAPDKAAPPEPLPAPPPASPPWAWITACTALAIALLSTALWWRSVHLLEGLSEQVAQLRTPRVASLTPALPAVAAATPAPEAAPAAAVEARPIVVLVPYGADALGGGRLEVIGKLLNRLAAEKRSANLDVRTYAARFCLMGNASDGYSLAPDEMLYSRCDVVGNPSDEALSPAQRTPLALANLIGDVRSSTNGAVAVHLALGDPAQLAQPYPQVAPDLTAGEWNRAAIANNRVEIRVH